MIIVFLSLNRKTCLVRIYSLCVRFDLYQRGFCIKKTTLPLYNIIIQQYTDKAYINKYIDIGFQDKPSMYTGLSLRPFRCQLNLERIGIPWNS